jgi:hypothetical protein
MAGTALLLAMFLHRPPALVAMVYNAGGIDAVAVVECESEFNPKALRREPRGHTSWGLFQLDNEYHPQHRADLAAHIAEGVAFLQWCKKNSGGDFAAAVTLYNGSPEWGRVVAKRKKMMLDWLHGV